MKKHVLSTLILALLMVSRAGAEDIAAPLTLDTALQRFRTRAFDLIIADASIASASADVAVAGAIANPSLSLSRGSSSTYDPSQCAGCSNTSISAGLTDQGGISDLVTGKRRLRIDVANAALDIAKRSRADVERTLEFTLKQQLLQAELGKQSVAYARDALRLSTDTLTLVNTRYKAGAVSEADVARAEVQELEAEQSVNMSAQTLDVAKAGVAYLLAYDLSPVTLDVSDDLIRDVATTRIAATSADDLLQRALASRPDLAAVRFQTRRARASIDLARRLRVPDVLPSLQYSQEGRGQNAIQPPTVTFGFSTTLPAFYRYSGEIARAEADLRTQETTQTRVVAQVRSDVASAFAAFSGARSRTERMRQLLARAGRARDLVRLQYEKGAASLFEFLDAQRTYLGVQSESLQTLNDYWTAVFQMEQAVGVELRQ